MSPSSFGASFNPQNTQKTDFRGLPKHRNKNEITKRGWIPTSCFLCLCLGPLGIEHSLLVAVRWEIMRPHAPRSPSIHQATPEEEADDNKSCHEKNPIGAILKDEKKLENIIDIFKLKEIYNGHTSEVSELIKLQRITNGNYLDILKNKTYEDFNISSDDDSNFLADFSVVTKVVSLTIMYSCNVDTNVVIVLTGNSSKYPFVPA